MHVGDIEDEILDADRNVIGYIVRQGIDGLSALELRNWRQLVFRRIEEERPK